MSESDLGVVLAALLGLVVGAALMFLGLMNVNRTPTVRPWSYPEWYSYSYPPTRGRRPAVVDAPRARRSALPPVRGDVAHGSTAPPPAGGRARLLKLPDMGPQRRGRGEPEDVA
jgi:hypothetical protein